MTKKQTKKTNVTVLEARKAFRKYSGRENDKVYANTLKIVGNDLEYGSSRYIAAGLLNLYNDSIYTLWEPIKDILNSPLIKQVIESKVGENKSLTDYLKTVTAQKSTLEEKAKSIPHLNNLMGLLKMFDNYSINLADYCNSTGKSPDTVLRSTSHRLAVTEKTHGSFENYENFVNDSLKAYDQIIESLKSVENFPINAMISESMTENDLDSDQLAQIGVNPVSLGKIGQSFMNDLTKFAKVYLREHYEHTKAELKIFKRIKSKRSK